MTDDDFVKTSLRSFFGATFVRVCVRCGALVADDLEGAPEGAPTPSMAHRVFHEHLDALAVTVAGLRH